MKGSLQRSQALVTMYWSRTTRNVAFNQLLEKTTTVQNTRFDSDESSRKGFGRIQVQKKIPAQNKKYAT
jgi:hypothetical protein